MKNKKIIIYVVAALILVFVVLALLGVFGKKNNTTEDPDSNNVQNKEVNVTSGENKVKFFDSIIEQQELIKANKTTTDGVFEATFEEKLVVKFIDPEGTNDIVKEVPEITNVKALSGFTDKEQRLRLYVLTETGEFYLIEWSKSTTLKMTKYNLPNIESFIAIYGDLDGNTQLFAIIKTTDGKYYSDYMFGGSTKRELKVVVNDDTVETVEEPQE